MQNPVSDERDAWNSAKCLEERSLEMPTNAELAAFSQFRKQLARYFDEAAPPCDGTGIMTVSFRFVTSGESSELVDIRGQAGI